MKLLAEVLALAVLAIASPARSADPAEALVVKASALDEALQADKALQLYLQAEALEPKRADVQIGISRQYRHLMADTAVLSEKRALLDKALDHADKAVALAPKNPEAYLARAITYAKRTPLESSRKNVELGRLMKVEIDRVLILDPRDDTAWHLLGRWNESYANLSAPRRAIGELIFGKLPVTTHEQAAKCFERALAENPDRLMHYIELGRTYAAMGRADDARRLILKGLSMPNRDKDDPETKRRGSETLAELR